jgi:soluble lytic murein transglycosylase
VLLSLTLLVALPGLAQAQEAPTPTASPADLEVARELAAEGDNEGAIAAYREYIEVGSQTEGSAARLELAKLLIAEGDGASAALHLEAYLLESGSGGNVQDAQFLLAEALSQRSDWSGALTLYDAYLASGGQAADYARAGRAKALAGLGRGADAETEALALLEAELPAPVHSSLIRSLAEIFEAREDSSRALDWYARLASAGSPSEQALALWRSALVRLQAGDARWQDDLIALVQRYPSTYTALEAVNAFPELETLVDEFYIGLVLYQHGEDEEARPILQRTRDADRSPNAARAAYYLAVIDERLGDEDAAAAGYASVLEIDPAIELADDALWWRGRLRESDGDAQGARADYERLASEFSDSDRGREARFRLALLDYDSGSYEEAAEAYDDLAAGLSGDERARALLWRGKALAAQGSQEAAEAVWTSMLDLNSDGYFSLRAAVLLGRGTDAVSDGDLPGDDSDWPAIEDWLIEVTGDASGETAAPPSMADRHFAIGSSLASLGMQAEADAEFETALFAAGNDPGQLLELARRFDALNLHHLSSRSATRLLDVVDDEDAAVAPEDLWRAAYPVPFSDALLAATESSDVPPLLLLSMIRQESFFNPRAGSPAGALGLTQVIGPTGGAIAEELGESGFEVENLYRPSTSLQFGAHYLAQQLDGFDGDVYQALAAYNGGPGNAQRWGEASNGDVDRFYEEIDFAETRLYIKLVGENLARNQQLYGGSDQPALPED